DAEMRYETQMCKLVLEKQELEWQKGKHQLSAEMKDKEITSLKEELKLLQELLSSLQHAQFLLQAESQALSRTEQQLLRYTEEYQVLKREHEMIQKRGQDKEVELMQLIEEHKNSQITLEKEMQILRAKMQTDQEELKAVREAYDHLHKKRHQLSSRVMHQATHIQMLENGVRDNFNTQRQSPSSLNCHIHLDIAGNLSKDASLDTEGREVSPQNSFEQMRHCKETEDIPDERTVECQEAEKDGCFHRENNKVNVGSLTDGNVLLPLQGPDLSVMEESGSTTDMLVTNQQKDPAVRQEASVGKSVPVCTTFDNDCPSNDMRSYADGCLAKLSEPETRSVYGVANDPVMSETRTRPKAQSLSVSEMQEHQTSDKHTSKTSQDTDLKEAKPKTTAPDSNSFQSESPKESKMTAERQSTTNPVLQNNDAHHENPAMHKQLNVACLSPLQQSLPQQSDSLHVRVLPIAAAVPDAHCEKSRDQFSQHPEAPELQQALEDASSDQGMIETKSVLEAELNISATPPGSFSQSNIGYTFNLAETPIENRTEDTAISAQTLSEQSADMCPSPQVSNSHGSSLPSARLTKPNEQLNDSQKQITGAALLTMPLNKSNIHPNQESDQHGEWNAIKQMFSEIASEKENRVRISFGSAQPDSPAARPVGSALRQDCTSPSARPHGQGNVDRPACERSMPTPPEKEDRPHSDIRAQITKIEQFLASEGFKPPKRSPQSDSISAFWSPKKTDTRVEELLLSSSPPPPPPPLLSLHSENSVLMGPSH
ncbi:hypothetical protein P4O66_020589, partial [Electrophorus voltai]